MCKKNDWRKIIEKYTSLNECYQENDFSIVKKNRLDIVCFEILNNIYNLQEINKLFPYYIKALKRPDFNNELILNDFNNLIFLIFKSMAISIREFNDYMYVFSKKSNINLYSSR